MSNIFITDTHCHLDYLDKPIDEVLQEAEDKGVKHFMTIAVEEQETLELKQLERPALTIIMTLIKKKYS